MLRLVGVFGRIVVVGYYREFFQVLNIQILFVTVVTVKALVV